MYRNGVVRSEQALIWLWLALRKRMCFMARGFGVKEKLAARAGGRPCRRGYYARRCSLGNAICLAREINRKYYRSKARSSEVSEAGNRNGSIVTIVWRQHMSSARNIEKCCMAIGMAAMPKSSSSARMAHRDIHIIIWRRNHYTACVKKS